MTARERVGVERLLASEPEFAPGAPPAGKWIETRSPGGMVHLGNVRYRPEVDDFFNAVHEEFTEGDYLERLRALGGLDRPPEWFARASYPTLRTVLFAISRGERFSDGLRLEHCANGTVRQCLARLRELLP